MELKRDKTVRCDYTIPESIVKRLKVLCKNEKLSMSRLIAHLLDDYLKQRSA